MEVFKIARITGLTIETNDLSARVMVEPDNEHSYLIGFRAGTSMLRITEKDLWKLHEQIDCIGHATIIALLSQEHQKDDPIAAAAEAARQKEFEEFCKEFEEYGGED